jgi:hypothetical protein
MADEAREAKKHRLEKADLIRTTLYMYFSVTAMVSYRTRISQVLATLITTEAHSSS